MTPDPLLFLQKDMGGGSAGRRVSSLALPKELLQQSHFGDTKHLLDPSVCKGAAASGPYSEAS